MSVGQEVGPEGEKTEAKDGGVAPSSTITPSPPHLEAHAVCFLDG